MCMYVVKDTIMLLTNNTKERIIQHQSDQQDEWGWRPQVEDALHCTTKSSPIKAEISRDEYYQTFSLKTFPISWCEQAFSGYMYTINNRSLKEFSHWLDLHVYGNHWLKLKTNKTHSASFTKSFIKYQVTWTLSLRYNFSSRTDKQEKSPMVPCCLASSDC